MSKRKYPTRTRTDYILKRRATMWNYYVHTIRHNRDVSMSEIAGRFYSLPYGVRLLESMEAGFQDMDFWQGVENSLLSDAPDEPESAVNEDDEAVSYVDVPFDDEWRSTGGWGMQGRLGGRSARSPRVSNALG